MTQDKLDKMKACKHFLPDPAPEVVGELIEEIEHLRNALLPFARMDRPDCNLNETASVRGTASDMTIITSGDFRNAAVSLWR